MPGTIRRIIDRIKEERSGGNPVVALTVETRLVLQGFDPQRFGEDAEDDPARLARLRDIAAEMQVEIDDLLAHADHAPDPTAEPGPMPGPPVRSVEVADAGAMPAPASAAEGRRHAAAAAPGAASDSPAPGVADPGIADDHPLHQFRDIADEILANLEADPGARTGVTFGQLMKASLLLVLHSLSGDRALCERLAGDATYRWFLGLGAAGETFDANDFGLDREDALESEAGRQFFDQLVPWAGRLGLFRSAELKVNGPLLKSWMSQ